VTALSFKYAYRHVRAGFGRMVLSIIAIALGVALVVAFQLMNAAVLQSFLDTIDAMAGRAQVMVSAGEGLSFSETILDKVRAVPGVKLAVPLVRSSAFPDDGSGEMLTVQGVDLTNESAIRVYHDADKASGSPDGVIDDMVEFLNSPDSIILGREFADKRGLRKGDTLPLVTPNGIQGFTIKGLLDAEGLAQTLRGRIVVMDLFAAERAFTGDGQINQIDVLLDEGEDVGHVIATIASVAGPGLRVEEPATRKGVIQSMISGFQTMLTAFSLLSIIAGFVICFGRLSTIFESRTWEVGVMRALGMTQRRALLELLKESLLLGTLGTVLGVACGSLLGRQALPFFAATTAIAFRMPILSAETGTSPWAYLLGATVGLSATLGAALLPAARLAQLQPIAALRLRGREISYAEGDTFRRRLQVVLLSLLVSALALQKQTNDPVFGLGTTVLIAALTATISLPVVRYVPRLLVDTWGSMLGPTCRLAASNILQHARRSALTVTTLSLGLGMVILLGILEWSFERTVISNFTQHISAQVVVNSPPSGGQWAPLGEDLVARVESSEHIIAAGGEQIREMQDSQGSFRLASYDATCFGDPRLFTWRLLPGAVPNAEEHIAKNEGAFLSSSFARLRRVGVGDNIDLSSPTGTVTLRVLALSEAPMEPAVVLNRALYRQRWNDPAVTFIFAATKEGAEAAAESAIAQNLGAKYRLNAQMRANYVEYFVGLVREGFAIQNLLAITVFALVSVALSDAFASSVIERSRQFGMLRAVGLSQSDVFYSVLAESSIVALLGLLLAIAFGVIEGTFWVAVQFPALAGWTFTFHFPTVYTINVTVIAFSLCLLGGALPALRAARILVAVALRTE